MSKVKGQGSSKNNRKSAGKRLGVKVYGGQTVKKGDVIIRQVGMTKRAGTGTYMSRNFSIHAEKDGTVEFKQIRVKRFTGRSVPRTEVRVV
ncbi:MAG: 50S ribosomal protein L27 [Patescibacteria group bacterium]